MTVEVILFGLCFECRGVRFYLGVPVFELFPWLYRWLESAVEDL